MLKCRLLVLVVLTAALMLALLSACGTAAEPGAADDPAPVEEAPAPPPPADDDDDEPVIAVGDDIVWEDITYDVPFEQLPNPAESPFLAGRGLPPLQERLPLVPKLVNELPADQLDFQVGRHGGTLRTVTSVIDWDADVFVMMNEPLLNTPGMVGREVTGNVLAGFEVSDDQMEFTFFMREGLRWSDGHPVTIEDVRFTVESMIFNPDFTVNIPIWMRSGGHRYGTPFEFSIVDDWTFRITFDEPYGGFLMRLASTGWVGYTEFINPSHYLKRFHIDYATEEEMARWDEYIERYSITRNDENPELTWINVFNQFRITNWAVCQRRGIGYPALTPWLLVSATDTLWVYERNPFYFKVDPQGNQLPYIDRIESTMVADMEMVQLMDISGEVDFMRESAALMNMPLYRAHEEDGGFVTKMAHMHVTPTDIFLNMTWGDEGYREMTNDVRFRRALMWAVDTELIIEALYFGFAETNPWQDWRNDPEAAIELLYEMGMERGPDGFFLQPNGEPFQIIFEHGAAAPDIGPMAELIAEFWSDIGVNTTVRRIEGALVGQRQGANELQAQVIWTHTPMWTHLDWGFGMWGPLWNHWRHGTTQITYTDPDTGEIRTRPVAGETPPQEVQDFYNLVDSLMRVPTEEASTRVFDEIRQSMNDNIWYFVPLVNVRQPVVLNNRLRNVTDRGFAIGLNFSGEQLWFDD